MINSEQIGRVITSRGKKVVQASDQQLALFLNVLNNPDIGEYLQGCTPNELVELGELSLHPIDRIEGEIAEGARPGPTIFRLGHLPIASTIGGQLLCVSKEDGKVRWADGSYICDQYICYFDGTRLQELAVTEENLVRRMLVVAEDLLELFELVESGEINQIVIDLDLAD